MEKAKIAKRVILFLIIVEFFNGLSGVAGGVGLIADPTAAALGMKLEWLQGTPFSNYLIPGIVLLVFNGLGNIIAAFLSIFKNRHRAYIALFFGFVMMIWIISQVALIGYKSFLQPLYFSTGLLQAILGALLLKHEKTKQK
jgi:CDP-diglyceride synthetase